VSTSDRSTLRGRVIVVVGASQGIGAEVARALAAAGAKLVLVARGAERLQAFAATLPGDPADVFALQADIADPTAGRMILERTVARFGGLDVLINNAALHHWGPVESVDPEALAAMVDVNLRAVVDLTTRALPHLRARGGGVVVQVASLAGCVPTPGSATYSATKFGVRAFSRALDEELRGSGIRIKVVSPGPVDTGFILDDLDRVTDLTLSQPMSTAAQVADAVIDAILNDRFENKMPGTSGALTTLGYVAPGLARLLRPLLERKGRAAKARLKAAQGGAGPRSD
jgi:short-subunit dehydrogenase